MDVRWKKKFGDSVEWEREDWPEGGGQGWLERHRRITGVTKTSRSKLVEQAT